MDLQTSCPVRPRVSDKWIWFEIAAGLALTAVLLAAHIVALRSAGALWRDEAHSVAMAEYPSIVATWWNDSFPVLWQLVVRGWIALGLGGSDLTLRLLGLSCGILQLAAIWWSARQFGVRIPWMLLVLLGFNVPLIIFGDSFRGYGLGLALQILVPAQVWRVLERPTWTRFAVLQIVSLLAVQAAFINSFMLLAAYAGAGLVCCRRRQLRVLMGLLAVGILSASSMVPYVLSVFHWQSEWAFVIRREYSWIWYLAMFWQMLSTPGLVWPFVWPLATGLAVCRAIFVLVYYHRRPECAAAFDQALFLLGNLVVGAAGFWWYIRFLSVYTAPWYYLPFIALLAFSIELAFSLWARDRYYRQVARMAVALCLFAGMLPGNWPALAFRFTNVDLAAQRIAREATADDLVIVTPWFVGNTFARYYRGAAPWMNFPDVGRKPETLNGYQDMQRDYMPRPDPIRGELERIEQTLRHGHRVWIVGSLNFLPNGTAPLQLTPAPHPQFGWSLKSYEDSWSQQAAVVVRSHATSMRQVRLIVPPQVRVNPFENMPLFLVEGQTLESGAEAVE